MKHKPKIPEYFKDLPDDAILNSSDVAKIFGYKNTAQAYKDGKIPKPDEKKYSSTRDSFLPRNFWKVKTIREWIENDNRSIHSKT